jgi:hypothetical protein
VVFERAEGEADVVAREAGHVAAHERNAAGAAAERLVEGGGHARTEVGTRLREAGLAGEPALHLVQRVGGREEQHTRVLAAIGPRGRHHCLRHRAVQPGGALRTQGGDQTGLDRARARRLQEDGEDGLGQALTLAA